MTPENNELIYIWDAYCGWCYGFSSTLGKLHANHPELPLSVWSGGLFTGDNAQPIGVQGYPTLLLRKGDSLYQLGGSSSTLNVLEERLSGVLS